MHKEKIIAEYETLNFPFHLFTPAAKKRKRKKYHAKCTNLSKPGIFINFTLFNESPERALPINISTAHTIALTNDLFIICYLQKTNV